MGIQSIQNNPSKAIQLLESHLQKNGMDPLVINALGSLYQQSNQPERANHYLQLRKEVFGY
jgi:uncharacterized protein HemY